MMRAAVDVTYSTELSQVLNTVVEHQVFRVSHADLSVVMVGFAVWNEDLDVFMEGYEVFEAEEEAKERENAKLQKVNSEPFLIALCMSGC